MTLHVGILKIYSIYKGNKMTKIFNYILNRIICVSTLKVENNYPFWQMLGADFYLFQV